MLSSLQITMFMSTLAAVTTAGTLPAGLRLLPRGTGYDGLTFEDITWTGPIIPGGQNHTFTGTIENVMAQIKEINPDYVPQAADTDDQISAQDFDPWITHVLCKVAAPGACETPYANEGVSYLKGFGADFDCQLEPGRCGQVSCSNNAGITWCNDSKGKFVLKCRDLWQGAAQVVDKCTDSYTDIEGDVDEFTWGQAFSRYDFNVIVGHSSC